VSDYGRQEIIKHAKNRPGSSGLSTSVLEAMAIIKGFTEHRSDGPYITRKTTRHGINVSTAHALIRRGLARESFGRPGNNHITLTDEGCRVLAEAGPVEVSV
jgi:CTP:molybdopterin cytidylyltransferase MocA